METITLSLCIQDLFVYLAVSIHIDIASHVSRLLVYTLCLSFTSCSIATRALRDRKGEKKRRLKERKKALEVLFPFFFSREAVEHLQRD